MGELLLSLTPACSRPPPQSTSGEGPSAANPEGAAGEEGEAAGAEEEEEPEAEGEDGLSATTGELLSLARAPQSGGGLMVTAGGPGPAARSVWLLQPGQPTAAPLLEGFASAPVTAVGFSPDGRLALMGSGDGRVRVQPLAGEDRATAAGRAGQGRRPQRTASSPPSRLSKHRPSSCCTACPHAQCAPRPAPPGPYGSPTGPAWEAPLHDMHSGAVAGVALAAQGGLLVSAGRDGALHVLVRPHAAARMPAPISASPKAGQQ
jgi:hypothetical protein